MGRDFSVAAERMLCMKNLVTAMLAAALLLSGCADLNDSEKFGADEVGKSARRYIKDHRGTKAQDACQIAVDALPKDQLSKYNKDDVVKGCVRANTGDE